MKLFSVYSRREIITSILLLLLVGVVGVAAVRNIHHAAQVQGHKTKTIKDIDGLFKEIGQAQGLKPISGTDGKVAASTSDICSGNAWPYYSSDKWNTECSYRETRFFDYGGADEGLKKVTQALYSQRFSYGTSTTVVYTTVQYGTFESGSIEEAYASPDLISKHDNIYNQNKLPEQYIYGGKMLAIAIERVYIKQ